MAKLITGISFRGILPLQSLCNNEKAVIKIQATSCPHPFLKSNFQFWAFFHHHYTVPLWPCGINFGDCLAILLVLIKVRQVSSSYLVQ